MDESAASASGSSRTPRMPRPDAIEAGWAEMMAASPVTADRGDCIVLGDSDLFDVEPLR